MASDEHGGMLSLVPIIVRTVATYVTPEAGTATATMIEVAGVDKVYRTGRLEYRALCGVDLSIAAGEMVTFASASVLYARLSPFGSARTKTLKKFDPSRSTLPPPR
jgi:hypothetical protein